MCLPIDAFDPKTPYSQLPNGKRYECYKKCGGRKISEIGRIEKNVLNQLVFTCQHKDEHGCEAVIKYENYKKHLETECVHKIVFPVEKTPGLTICLETKAEGLLMQQADLPNLFGEEEEDNEWRFAQPAAAAPQVPPPVDEDEVDMGALFGDDDDY